MRDFEQELTELLNKHSAENRSDTPDFILAKYLLDCLESWNRAVSQRETWYGNKRKPEDVIEGITT